MNRINTMNRTGSVLTDEQLRIAAPSIFATQPWHAMSDRYAFIPTSDVVTKLRGEGFQPVAATQSATRIEGKGAFTKHVIRFRDMRQGDAPVVRRLGMLFAELVLTNSHDGASVYQLDAGLFRLICLNGMTVADHTVAPIKVRHTGNADGIINATYEVVEQFPKVLDSVERFSQLRLAAPAREAYAAAALTLKYDDAAPIAPAALLAPRRMDDAEPTLWNTYNTVQEHLVKGGDRGRTQAASHRRVKTRAVTGIAEDSRLNKALWTLTEKMQELAG